MVTIKHDGKHMTAPTSRAIDDARVRPDPAWHSLYRAGGIAAWLYIVVALIVPTVMLMTGGYDVAMDGAAILGFIADHQVWWYTFQALVLETSILPIVTCLALFVVLKHLDRSWAAIGAIVAGSSQLLFMAYYPVLAGLAHLGKLYADATSPQQAVFATAAEALLAQNNAFNPIYEPLFALGILIISLVMLKGVFHKSVAYLGIATFVSSIVGVVLAPLVGLWYFLWWLFLAAWLIAVGWKLYRLGSTSNMD